MSKDGHRPPSCWLWSGRKDEIEENIFGRLNGEDSSARGNRRNKTARGLKVQSPEFSKGKCADGARKNLQCRSRSRDRAKRTGCRGLLSEENSLHRRESEYCAFATETKIKAYGRSGRLLDLSADLFERRGYASGREEAGHGDVAPRNAACNLLKDVIVEQKRQDLAIDSRLKILGIIAIRTATQLAKFFVSSNRISGSIMYSVGDDQKIAGVLIEMLV